MTKLTYEEWRAKFTAEVDPTLIAEAEELHKIDIAAEMEAAFRAEYEFYLNGGFDELAKEKSN